MLISPRWESKMVIAAPIKVPPPNTVAPPTSAPPSTTPSPSTAARQLDKLFH
ncbi:MAG: hypothetical protein HZC38_07735 [Chloroflexi bacterium]|nr:hypothetical protein [Chloroflexota bacterium]MBI5713299.1 hypothetical protein [Chloroflexota bacterium]